MRCARRPFSSVEKRSPTSAFVSSVSGDATNGVGAFARSAGTSIVTSATSGAEGAAGACPSSSGRFPSSGVSASIVIIPVQNDKSDRHVRDLRDILVPASAQTDDNGALVAPAPTLFQHVRD